MAKMTHDELRGLLEKEEISEAKMETEDGGKAEDDSKAATDEAGDATKKSPGRKGDKLDNGDKTADKMKNGFVNEMKKKVKSKMSEEDDMEDDEDEEDDEEEMDENFSVSAELSSLMEDEATLSESFKTSAKVLFETAINKSRKETIKRLEEQAEARLDEELESFKNELIENVDGYLNYVVDEWMKENKLAVENGIRTEIAEDFMGKLKDLFLESYIDVPESKINVVDELAEKLEEMEGKLNEATDKLILQTEELTEYKKDAIIREASIGLVDTQADKLAKLVEDLEFNDEESFIEKVVTLRDTHFTKKAPNMNLSEEAENFDEEKEISEEMKSYVNALKNFRR